MNSFCKFTTVRRANAAAPRRPCRRLAVGCIADCQSANATTSAITTNGSNQPLRFCALAAKPVANRRYSRLPICATCGRTAWPGGRLGHPRRGGAPPGRPTGSVWRPASAGAPAGPETSLTRNPRNPSTWAGNFRSRAVTACPNRADDSGLVFIDNALLEFKQIQKELRRQQVKTERLRVVSRRTMNQTWGILRRVEATL